MDGASHEEASWYQGVPATANRAVVMRCLGRGSHSGYEGLVPSAAWPIEELWGRPIATLIFAALLPFATARALAALTLPPRVPDDPTQAASAVAAFRTGALIVGVVQVQLSWTLGATALGPALVGAHEMLASAIFAGLCAAITFLAGAPARAIESRPARPKPWPGIALRLRAIPWLAGPVLVATACTALPLIDREGNVRPLVVALALALTFVGVAYAGPALSVLTRALVPATEPVASLARRAASREGISLAMVLRLPTHGARFANAAALPWARTMVVTDHIVELLDEEELDAVLAHEAGHLSEPIWVSLCRLGTVTLLLFVSSTGTLLGETLAPGSSWLVLIVTIAIALPMLTALLSLARKMEERADARARATVSPDALADALTKLARDARAPLVSGRKRARMHPDLFDRICACGRDLGPPPPPPNRRPGIVAALLIGVGLVAVPFVLEGATRIAPGTEADAGSTAATWRLRVDPSDGSAMLALAWSSARRGDPERAAVQETEARRLGVAESDAMELDAELLARTGRCDEARQRFEASISTRAAERFDASPWGPLELGGYHIPPALVSECGYGEGTRGTW